MKLIVGLGNPGLKYRNNRHNVGFMVVDRFAKTHQIDLSIRKKKAVFGRGTFKGHGLVLLKPQTFMNLSGEAVLYLASFLKIKTQDIIAIADDTELPLGKIRIRRSGGHGGHNGIRSLINSLKSEDFPRLRFGIGRPANISDKDLCDFVLDNFTQDEMNTISNEFDTVVQAIDAMIVDSVEKAMNVFNKK